MTDACTDITGLLRAWAGGDSAALDQLTPLVYGELRRIARRYLRRRSSGSIETTELVHEAYLKLAGAAELPWQDRAHFFAVAAQMMRRILVDSARAHFAAKRQAGAFRITFSEGLPAAAWDRDSSIVDLDDALNTLAKLDERKAKVVELRFFGGLSVDETAEVLQVSSQTVLRDWRLAKPWLAREIGKRRERDEEQQEAARHAR